MDQVIILKSPSFPLFRSLSTILSNNNRVVENEVKVEKVKKAKNEMK